jgi:chloride channel protein, CIC family
MFQARFKRVLTRLQNSGDLKIGAFVLAVGVLGGLGTVVFRDLIDAVKWLFFGQTRFLAQSLGSWYVILVPAFGITAVAYIVNRWAIEAKGHGVPEVQYAVRKQGGKIRPRVAFVKILASALCIGTGGSVGREGPIVQIGATLGSVLGQIGSLPTELVRLLVACGAAAGISGTFNAPIAGVIFALEVVLGSFSGRAFGFIVVSAITSTAIRQAIMGDTPSFQLAEVFQLRSPLELPLYLLMGLLLGALAILFVKSVYFFEDFMEKIRAHRLLKAALGGLAVGLLGYFGSPFLFGVGYDGIDSALKNGMAFKMLLLLALLKILATSLTLGAGGSGGIFAPSLFIGAMSGGAYGGVVNRLFPGVCASPGAYAMVGMAALFAGAAHAPITAIVILFEMTNDYRVILPLMLATVVSYLFSSTLAPDSIYFIKLRRRGGLVPDQAPSSVLDHILVADAMATGPETVLSEVKISEFAKQLYGSPNRSFPVLDREGFLVGMVSEKDVARALRDGKSEGKAVADIMTRDLFTCTPQQNLRSVLENCKDRSFRKIPVVDPGDKRVLRGLLARENIFWAYGELSNEYQNYQAQGRKEISDV